MIAGKEQVWENEKAKYTKRSNIPEVTKSWHKYMVKVLCWTFSLFFRLYSVFCTWISKYLILEIFNLLASCTRLSANYYPSGWQSIRWRNSTNYATTGIRISQWISSRIWCWKIPYLWTPLWPKRLKRSGYHNAGGWASSINLCRNVWRRFKTGIIIYHCEIF